MHMPSYKCRNLLEMIEQIGDSRINSQNPKFIIYLFDKITKNVQPNIFRVRKCHIYFARQQFPNEIDPFW
jgi:hypothetical protein